jgi:hypothetical protein
LVGFLTKNKKTTKIRRIGVAALIEESFQKYKIVPEVIPKGPREALDVLYGDDEVKGNL